MLVITSVTSGLRVSIAKTLFAEKVIVWTFPFMSKALLTSYAELLFHSLRPHGIAVTRIIPGAIDTDTWQGLDVPREKFIPAGDVAHLIASIASLAPQTVPEELIIRPADPNW